MSDQNPKDLYRYIPKNVITKGKLLGFEYVNWIESVLITGIIIKLITMTDFVPKIKIICCSVIGICVFVLFLRGVKNRSIILFFADIIKNRSSQIKYSLGSASDERKHRKAGEEYNFGGMSFYEKVVHSIKTKFRAFDQKYGNE